MVKNWLANVGDMRRGFDSWVGKMPWRRPWQPTPVFLPGGSYGQRTLVGYSPQCHRVGCDCSHSARTHPSHRPESLPALPVCIPEVFPLASPADHSSLASPPPPRRVVSACLMSMLKAIPWAAATPLGFRLGFHRFESQPENRDHAKFASSSGTFLRPRVLCSVLFTSHTYYSVTVSNS